MDSKKVECPIPVVPTNRMLDLKKHHTKEMLAYHIERLELEMKEREGETAQSKINRDHYKRAWEALRAECKELKHRLERQQFRLNLAHAKLGEATVEIHLLKQPACEAAL